MALEQISTQLIIKKTLTREFDWNYFVEVAGVFLTQSFLGKLVSAGGQDIDFSFKNNFINNKSLYEEIKAHKDNLHINDILKIYSNVFKEFEQGVRVLGDTLTDFNWETDRMWIEFPDKVNQEFKLVNGFDDSNKQWYFERKMDQWYGNLWFNFHGYKLDIFPTITNSSMVSSLRIARLIFKEDIWPSIATDALPFKNIDDLLKW
ncbi:hypothetical protein [Spiroplasma eriocheiris]|uniref:Uncharacterized protein n=1 Tax=Spiroplasma eriocheiris TaxID=315358 RepID=A0A0H3XHW5_9MOLU|nr:hypothetical protein [Spiroplasma eriocheiris]AHF57544.1 hypothetical protein SPE_0415 [Spiroplasma eriocheiris CCTCC M 207170]AKM54000.1 hypothetical protein SERIO_v1c04210 [Spiroplasma eriocheiris]